MIDSFYKTAPLSLLFLSLAACSDDPSGGGGTGGAASTGGAGTGSAAGVGGGSSGGSSSGGSSSGGSSSGGAATGGSSTGGAGASGGSGGTGGEETGGTGGMMGGDVATFVYVGSGHWNGNESGKVTVYTIDRASRELSFVSDHDAGALASFLAIDANGGRLFAGDETGGGVLSFTIDKETGQLTALGPTASANQPAYVAVDATGSHVFTANYNQGNVEVFPVQGDGKAGDSTQTIATGTNAHCVAMDGNGNIFVPNKADNTISQLSFVGGMLTPNASPTTSLTSPRHMVVRDSNAYVVSEDADLVTGYEIMGDGTLSQLWDIARLDTGMANGMNKGADIHVSPDGRFLYASNREPSNTIVAYDISSGSPTLIEHEPTQGGTPRNFAIDPQGEFLIVGHHEDPKSIVVFDIMDDGSLEFATSLTPDFSTQFVGIVQF